MIETGQLLAVPVDLDRGDPARFTRFLDFLTTHPGWFSSPADPETLRLSAGWLLSAPANAPLPLAINYEVWKQGEFIGIVSLTRITPGVDALLHFIFMDTGHLVGKRRFLLAFLRHCYLRHGFQRITFECPEPLGKLIRFARRNLGFTYEGERTLKAEGWPSKVHWNGDENEGITWAARVGSRRESCHWHDGRWWPVVVMRQTADEFADFLKTQEGRKE